MEDNKYEVSFELILNAGNSKSKSLMAIESAREFDFEQAEALIKEAAEDLKAAHNSQSQMIQAEARGEEQEVNVILVHAQDHLTTAMIMIEQAKEFINVYKILKEVKERG